MADSKIVIENGKVLTEGGLVRSAVDPCACCGECPVEIEVTLAGLDAARCTSCENYRTTESVIMSASAIDGVYLLAYQETDATGCKYLLADAATISFDVYPSRPCGGKGEATSQSADLTVWLDPNTLNVVRSEFLSEHAVAFRNSASSVALGSPVGNQTFCGGDFVFGFGYAPHYCNGGTLTADLP